MPKKKTTIRELEEQSEYVPGRTTADLTKYLKFKKHKRRRKHNDVPTTPTTYHPHVSERTRDAGKQGIIQVEIDSSLSGQDLIDAYATAIKAAKEQQAICQFYLDNKKTAFAYYYPDRGVFSLKTSAPTKAIEKLPVSSIRRFTSSSTRQYYTKSIELIDRNKVIAHWYASSLNIIKSEPNMIDRLPLAAIVSNLEGKKLKLNINWQYVGSVTDTLRIKTAAARENTPSVTLFSKLWTQSSKVKTMKASAKNAADVNADDDNYKFVSVLKTNANNAPTDIGYFRVNRNEMDKKEETLIAQYNIRSNRLTVFDVGYIDVVPEDIRKNAEIFLHEVNEVKEVEELDEVDEVDEGYADMGTGGFDEDAGGMYVEPTPVGNVVNPTPVVNVVDPYANMSLEQLKEALMNRIRTATIEDREELVKMDKTLQARQAAREVDLPRSPGNTQ